ncbi:MAG TPA: hypothetical protein PKA03_14505 [Tabrizicola sp.]|nr:hypothetical protein [Tabrizicola sp.]
MTFDSLDPALILQTTERLERRIAERFPDRGLRQVAMELTGLAQGIASETSRLGPPIWGLRVLVALIVAGGAAVFLWIGSIIPLHQVGRDAVGSVEGVEALINTSVLAALGLVALARLEARVKLRRVGRGLHRLRSVIHVIDMHQLTKDPVVLDETYRTTAHSPARDLTPIEMSRYLDYCSELLAITGKLAALYAQAVPVDSVARAVNDIETLGANLSRKIWQKITLIDMARPVRKRRVPE